MKGPTAALVGIAVRYEVDSFFFAGRYFGSPDRVISQIYMQW
jgi:hypothetical protein